VTVDADAWDERYAGRELVWSAGPNRFLAERAGDLAPGRALDLAAGEGRNSVWLAQQGWQVTAVDFSAVGLDKGRELARGAGVEDAIAWVHADVTTWVPPLGRFDLALVFYLQLPADQRRAAHRLAAGALAPGGTLLVVAHDLDNLTRGYGGPQDPDLLPTAAGIVDDLEGTGLEVVTAEQVERPVAVEGGDPVTALDCLVRARRPAGA
jgi:SAM-dependent methyltransferase